MWDSANTTARGSQVSFYEYPPEKPFTNSIYQPLRPVQTVSATVSLPESNRDQLLTALQSLTLRIKTLENERERAESSLRQITSDIHRSRTHSRRTPSAYDPQLKKPEQDLQPVRDQHRQDLYSPNEDRPRKPRVGRRKKQPSQEYLTSDAASADGRHFHLNMNSVPFILGASTSPSHNVKSNLQHVIALLKTHNHQLCLSSKEYSDLHHSSPRGDLSPHTVLYLDHYNKSSRRRPSSASPVRRSTAPSSGRSQSAFRRPQTSSMSNRQCQSRIKRLRQEFAILAHEHTRLSASRSHSRELEIINRRMELILEELEQLQRQLRKLASLASFQSDKNETPLETLRKTKLLQVILKDSTSGQPRRGRSRRARPKSND